MGNPGLLQELPDIAALLPQGGGDREQAAAADHTLAGLDAVTDLALNHRLAQGTFCGVIGGLDRLDIQEGPQPIGHLQELLAGAQRAGPRRSLAALTAQLHHPLKCALEVLANRPAALLQLIPVDCSVFVAMPVAKQLLLQGQQLRSDFTAGALTFSDGRQIADQVRPAQLTLLQGEIVVDREAIAHHDSAKGFPQQLDGGGGGAAQALHKHRHHGGHQPLRGSRWLHPLPAALTTGIAAIRITGRGAGFIHVDHRLLAGKGDGLIHRLLQRGAQIPADRCERPAADLYSQ